jgi:diguanylate cyclase (GGDEF)-like protein
MGLFLLFMLSLFSSSQAFASLQLSDEMSGLPITANTHVIEDPQRQLTIDDILRKDWSEFQLQKTDTKTVQGVSASAWWVMFEVDNQTDSTIDWILEAVYTHTDYIDLYLINEKGEVTTTLTGDKRPFDSRPISSESYAFPLSAAPHTHEKIVVRFAYDSTGMIELLLRGWDANAFQKYQTQSNYLFGGLFGAGLFVIVFTLIIHIPTRLPAYYWYLAYLIFVLGNCLANTGLGYRFIWHDSAFLTDSAHILASSLSFIFAIQFNRAFLQTKQFMPRADRFLQALLVIAIIAGLSYIFDYRSISVKLLLLTGILLGIMPLIGLWAWKVLKRSDARWYVLAWTVWSLALFVLVGRLLGVVEMSDTVLWTSRMGFLLETVLLSFALIDRINVLQQEKLTAEENLIHSLERVNNSLEEKVLERTIDLEEAKREAESMAETDVLTGGGNRRFFFSRGESALEMIKRLGYPLTLVMVDIDHFKKINDSYGHAAGDRVIKYVADLTQKRLRATDIFGRIGGEEFAFLLMGSGLEEALKLSELLRKEIEAAVVESPQGAISFTASFGVTTVIPQDSDLDASLHRADEALYQAKHNGRNRVESQ